MKIVKDIAINQNMAHMGAQNGLAPMPNAEVERHIRQNNERLICIQRVSVIYLYQTAVAPSPDI